MPKGIAPAFFRLLFLFFIFSFWLRPTAAARFIPLRNQFISAAVKFFFVFCFHFFNAFAIRFVEFSGVCIDYKFRLFCTVCVSIFYYRISIINPTIACRIINTDSRLDVIAKYIRNQNFFRLLYRLFPFSTKHRLHFL